MIVLLIKMWIAGTSNINELKFHLLRTMSIMLTRFTQNTVAYLINIKRAFVRCLLVFFFFFLGITTLVSLYQAAFVVLCLEV